MASKPRTGRIMTGFSRKVGLRQMRPGPALSAAILARAIRDLAPPHPSTDLPDAADAILTRLAERITPSPERLRAIRAKLPPSTISYDDEPGQPF